MIVELCAVRVFVNDLAEARSFYAGVLELPLTADDEPSGYCVLKAGSVDLVMESVRSDAPEEDRALVGRFTGLSFNVPDIQIAYAELLGKGVPFAGAPERQAWGGTLATFLDPAGNELQLVQRPLA
jgi:catechol 2,3-dioxygenase-like lactoylglutathione lyase family enzyme